MTPRRTAAAAALLAVLAVAAAVVATGATRSTAAVDRLLGQAGRTGAAALYNPAQAPALPSLGAATAWDNTAPLSAPGLRGRVVLVDFFTSSCINCRRTFGFLRGLDSTYRGRGLTVLGIHSPEFGFETSHRYVARSVRELGVTWPVAEDPHLDLWGEFGNQYWPAEYLFDRQGRLRYTHIGEGDDAATEGAIRALLDAGGNAGPVAVAQTAPGVNQPTDLSPETYLGATRGGTGAPVTTTGRVAVRPDFAALATGAALTVQVHARQVYALVAPDGAAPAQVEVLLDGAPVPVGRRGSDVVPGTGADTGRTVLAVTRDDLYHVLTGPAVASDRVTLRVLRGALAAYTFTFGG